MNLKEHQETIDRLRESVSKKTDEVSNMKMELENANIKLQEKVLIGHPICSCLKAFGVIKVPHPGKQFGSAHCKACISFPWVCTEKGKDHSAQPTTIFTAVYPE